MRKAIFSVLLVASCLSAGAQELTLPELGGFKKLTNYPVFTPDNLWDFINGAADTYLAYGFIDLHVAEYKKGKDVIKLEVYRHKNSIMAFGIYSTERSSTFRFMNIGTQGYIADGSINFFKGEYYVKIRTYSKKEKIRQTAESLAMQVADMLKGSNEMPAAITQFPDEGKKENAETYINESVLGHEFLNNAFRADYEAGNDNFSIFILDKSSAEDALKTVNAYLKLAGMEETMEENGKYVLKDGYNGDIFLAWKGPKIVIISGLAKDQSAVADRYTSEILKD